MLKSRQATSTPSPRRAWRFESLSFRQRVGLSLVACVAPAILFVGFSSYTLSAILRASQHEADTDDLGKEAAKTAAITLQCRRFEKDAILNCRDSEVQARYMAQWREAVDEADEKLKVLREECEPGAVLADAGTYAQLDKMIADLEKYAAAFERLIADGRAAGEQDPAALNAKLGESKEAVRGVVSSCEALNKEYTERAMPAEEAVHDALGSLATALMIGTVATLVLGAASAAVVPRLLTRRVTELGRFADAVREGDLKARIMIEGKDELGRLSQAINAMLETLESAVERERELATAEAEARQAGESKMRFMANMSHEIRTPMTAILGFTDLLLDPTLPPDARISHTETIRRNGNHLLGVINDILDLSKLQADKMALSIAPAPVCRLIAEVAAMVRVRAAEKGVPLNVVYEFPMPEYIQTDGLRLRQVLLNLMSNAVKFTEKGSVRLVARADGLDDSAPFITFDVIDTGVGMTREQLARLFQPFTQVDDSATRRFGGTGLGLCISKELAERLGGSLSVISQPGKGTTFTLRVPVGSMSGVRLVHNAEEALAETAPTPAKVASIRLSGRILLAEDGPDNQRLIKLVLTKAGAEVEVVENGELALKAALAAKEAGTPYGLILMDMQMPVMDGYSATSELRERGYTGAIMALTAHAMPHDRQRCLLAGCDDYTTKPIDRSVFLPLVQKHLAGMTDLTLAA